ncbi:MAG: proline--tRNA ligase [Candidatus Bipolaricaulia bacterium]
MRFSRYLLPTLKEDPKDAELASRRLLLRAGLIRPLSAGIYTYLPLGWRVLGKIERIIREEMDAIGGQELHLPIAHPAELWERSGRLADFGPQLIHFRDRSSREFVLGPTHEEVIADLARREIRSYRQLPLMLYQVQTKFRDEPRPRGGLIRAREFTMKDGYSFHENMADLDEYYPQVYQAYLNIFRRCGLEPLPIEADPGLMGGTGSHEFMLPHDLGEDTFVQCSRCDYAANLDNARAAHSSHNEEKELPLEEVATPGCWSIEAVANYLNVPRWKTAKAVFYKARDELIFAVIRGDLEVNEAKLARVLGTAEFGPASEEEIAAVGAVPGYASPIGLEDERIKVIVDDSIPIMKNLVAGANREGYHLRNVNFLRDFQADQIADIALVRDGDRCLRCGGELRVRRGIELGHIFKLGTKYSEALGAMVLDRSGKERPLIMGCYGIGTGRLLAAVVEQHHDGKGISWPVSIAPFQVMILVLNTEEPAQAELGERLYHKLRGEFEVLYDDRGESAGVKFNDADLIGIPLQVIIGGRGMEENRIEIKRRWDGRRREVPLTAGLEGACAALREELDAMGSGL